MRPHPLGRFGALVASAITVAVLVGCNGSTGPAGPAGTSSSSTPSTGYVVDAATISASDWIALNPKGQITSASVNAAGNPVVNFTITDGKGNPVKGLDLFTMHVANDPDGSYTLPNFYFEIAKLVPPPAGTPSAPSKWVSYIVNSAANKAHASAPQAPNSDVYGTLAGAGDGSYTYTFYTNLKTAATTLAAAGVDVTALGDVSYQPSLTHRVVMEFYGNARGTGSGRHANTPDGSAGATAAEIATAINPSYDFIPATGQKVTAADTSREIVILDTCQACHTKFNYHGAHRVDPKNCVTCHTDQRKFGATEAVKVDDGHGNFTFSGSAAMVNGTAELDFPQLIHQIHMGEGLKVAGYDLEIDSNIVGKSSVAVNEVRYPQNVTNCTTCHVTTAKAPQAGNWQTTPSREACGACHDTTQFLLGINHVPSSGFIVRDDTTCTQCHTPGDLALAHVPVTPPDYTNAGIPAANGGVASNSHTNSAFIGSPENLPPDAINVTWNIKTFSVDATTHHPSFVFNFKQNGVATPFNTYKPGEELWGGFVGSPNFIVAYGAPQDGIAAPVDYNVDKTASVKGVWAGLANTTFTGPDSDGYYTATLNTIYVPAGATLVSGGIGYTYGIVTQAAITGNTATSNSLPLTQTNVPGYPLNFVTYPGTTTAVAAPYQGGYCVATPNVWKTATGTTARRVIVDEAKCDACHKDLGVFTDGVFHSGQRNDAPTCVFCHNASGASSSPAGWTINIKEAVHALHASSIRTTPLTWQPQLAYWNTTYPAILNNCEACHVSGSYDFSSTSAALPSMLWTTNATGTMPASGVVLTDPSAYSAAASYISPFVTAGAVYGVNYSVNTTSAAVAGTWNSQAITVPAGGSTEAAPTTLVTSPISAACYACHDSSDAKLHMTQNGGKIGVARSTVVSPVVTSGALSVAHITNTETCLVCHGTDKVADIKKMHLNY